MQVEYKKEWIDTYLWILSEKDTEASYEEKMIKNNPGGGRLEFSRQEQEGNTYFCYKVTGKKALNSIFQKSNNMQYNCSVEMIFHQV